MSNHCSQSQVAFNNNPNACAIRTATHSTVKYLQVYEVRRAGGHRALAWIGGSLPLEVPIDGAPLHEIVPRSAHRTDNGFIVLKRDYKSMTRLFCKSLE